MDADLREVRLARFRAAPAQRIRVTRRLSAVFALWWIRNRLWFWLDLYSHASKYRGVTDGR
jgi:hypothetical protein